MVVKAIGVALSIIGDIVAVCTSSVECVVLLCFRVFLADRASALVDCGGGVACVAGTYVVERLVLGGTLKPHGDPPARYIILSEMPLH
jgi:hypothetical protein